jgi:hypothetical protein
MNASLLRSAGIAVLSVLLLQCGSKGPDLGKAEGPPPPNNNWKKFTSIDELYSLHYPVDWHLEEIDNNLILRPPDSTGAVVVWVRVDDDAEDDFIKTWLDEAFGPMTPTSEPERFIDNGWIGIQRQYHEAEKDRKWIGLAANRGDVFVLASVADATRRWQERGPILEEILGSLVLHGEP